MQNIFDTQNLKSLKYEPKKKHQNEKIRSKLRLKNLDPFHPKILTELCICSKVKGVLVLTCGVIEGVSSQSEGDAALMAREAAPVEELGLGADALQHVDPLTTEVTLLAVAHQNLRPRSRY